MITLLPLVASDASWISFFIDFGTLALGIVAAGIAWLIIIDSYVEWKETRFPTGKANHSDETAVQETPQ